MTDLQCRILRYLSLCLEFLTRVQVLSPPEFQMLSLIEKNSLKWHSKMTVLQCRILLYPLFGILISPGHTGIPLGGQHLEFSKCSRDKKSRNACNQKGPMDC
eukprot:TRINITY_DN49463_c0_g1_i1.p1 TRINITY_DN49463_c0_g1~~TRINITY_DN49463_c0_g1_i1.p1  ORF type:complete len:102 (+),score=10.25 TRINITY_DN49463_c0_g1_i1:384-689(+)